MEANKIKLDSVCRAMIEKSEEEGYDFKCTATPLNNGQVNRDYENNEYFMQVLMPTEENTRVERLKSGLPLFDAHPWEKRAMETLGISVGYDFTERGLEVKMKWGARADQQLKDDVMNGIVKTVSIEGDIYRYDITRELGKLPIYRAVDWEPTSLSFAPVPQDIESQIEVKRAITEQVKAQSTIKTNFINSLTKKFQK